MNLRVGRSFFGAMMVVLYGCGGGGGGSVPAVSAPTPTPTPSVNVMTFAAAGVGPGGLGSLRFPYIPGGLLGSVEFPPASAIASLSMSLSSTPTPGSPPVQAGSVLGYFTLTSSVTTHFAASIGATISAPGVTIVSGNQYLLFYDPTNAAAGWIPISGPGTAPNGPLEGENKGALTLQQGVTYVLVVITTQGTMVVPPSVP